MKQKKTNVHYYLLESSNTSNLIPRMNNSRCFSLCPCQDNINKFRRIWYMTNSFKVIDWHGKSDGQKELTIFEYGSYINLSFYLFNRYVVM